MTNIIFLDIDGVLNSIETMLVLHAGGKKWSPVSVGLMEKLVDEADAKIVVSSAWRGWKDLRSLKLMLLEHGAGYLSSACIGRTPQPGEMDYGLDHKRGHEIQNWLDRNEWTNYVIVDDDSDMLPGQNFVQTDIARGFGLREYVECLGILCPDRMYDGLRAYIK